MIKGMNSLGISVGDLDRSIAFCRELLLMEVTERAPVFHWAVQHFWA
jgi:catechol 2,3-dioxygenase-like lactoylglutathione lyase family enzyme